jgi:Icc-related predicted phosphoesterase
MILIVGDIHGDWASLNALIEQHKPDIILQCGDFGFWPGHIWRDPAKKLKPGSTHIHWIDGNHEDLRELHALVESGKRTLSVDMPNVIYQPRGSTLELPDGRNVLFAGGAFSVDNAVRLPGRDWFPDHELLTEDDLDNFPDPSQVQIDVVISHTAPREFNVKGLPYEQWPAWWDRTPDPSERVLNEVLRRYQPKQWFLGHFHRFQQDEFDGCKWTALDYSGSDRQWWIELES